MAKQIGTIKITGTVAGVTFYRMEGQYYARRKSSLTGKRVKRDPRFRRTMASARRLGSGSQLASKVYRSLPRQEQVYALYKELKSLAIHSLKEGLSEAEVLRVLAQRLAKHQKLPRRSVLKEGAEAIRRPSNLFAKRLAGVPRGPRGVPPAICRGSGRATRQPRPQEDVLRE